MPRYLALDFASEATKYRRGFFNKFLLVLPSCLGHGAENLADYRKRLPWTQIHSKGQKIKWTSLSGISLQEDIKQIPSLSVQAKQDLESLEEETVCKKSHVSEQDRIDKNQELDIVPSSNPDSPPLDSQTCESIQSRFVNKIATTTTAVVPPLDEATPLLLEDDVTARFLLEDTFGSSVTAKSVSSKSCEELCKQLGKKTVKDPFADLPAQSKLEVLQPRDTENAITSLASSTEGKHKLAVDLQNTGTQIRNKEMMLPDVLTTTSLTVQLPVISGILSHEEKLEVEVKTKFDWSETGSLHPLKDIRAPSVETLPSIPTSAPDHVTLNNDEQTSSGDNPFISLESPTTPTGGTAGTGNTGQLEPQSKLPLTPTDCFDTTIVSPTMKKRTEEQVWKSEQSLHDTVALSLKVPDSGITDIFSEATCIPVPRYTVSKEKDGNDAELELPWQPLQVPPETMKRYNRSVESLEGDKGQLPNLAVESYARETPVHFLEVSVDDDAVDAPLEHIEVSSEKGQNMKHSNLGYSPDDISEQNMQTIQRSDESPIDSHKCGQEHKNPVQMIGSETSTIEMQDSGQPIAASTTFSESSQSVVVVKDDDGRGRQSREMAADPLADFLKLRNRFSGSESRMPSHPLQPPQPPASKEATTASTQAVTAGKKEELVMENPDTKGSVVVPDIPLESPAVKPEYKKIKSRLVEVALTAPFLEMVRMLEEAANPVVSHLHKKGSLSLSYTFTNLTMDITRFLLVQHRKQNDAANPETKEEFQDSYKHMVLLHGYVTAANMITHCDAVTAIMHLGTVSETYHNILQGCMEQLRGALFKKQCLLPRNELHPKLRELAKLTGEWFQKKLKKEGRDHDPKVLVIVRRDSGKLAESISSVLSSIKGMSSCVLESSPTTYTAISNMLEKHNALVATPSQIDESFPWAQFGLVVEYEASPKSPWKDLCLRQRIRHIELRCVVDVAVAPASGCYDSGGTDLKKSTDDRGRKVDPLKLVGSEKITHSTTLLQLLETRHNVLIVERSGAYGQSSSSLPSKLPRADLIIDERTGVILQEMEMLQEDGSVEPLVRTITLLSRQFCVLWIILEGSSGANRYSLGGKVVANTTKLHAALSQLSSKSNDFEVKVMYSGNSDQTAAAIESICSFSQHTATPVWSLEDWQARPWLVDRLTRHEEFLVRFPCLNSMSAQIMLTAAPLTSLLTASLKNLVQLCPWIPRKMLESFYSIVHDMHPASIARDGQARRDQVFTRQAADANTVHRPIKEEHDITTEIQHDFEGEHFPTADTDHLLQRAEGTWPGMLNQHRKEMHHATVPRVKPEKEEGFPYCQESTCADATMARCHVPDDLKTPLELIAAYENRTDGNNDEYKLYYDPWDTPEGYTDPGTYRPVYGNRLTSDEDGASGQRCNWPQSGHAEGQEYSQKNISDQFFEGVTSADAEVPHSVTSRANKPHLNSSRLDILHSLRTYRERDKLDETSKPCQQRTMQSLHQKHCESRYVDHLSDESEVSYHGQSDRQRAVHARCADVGQHTCRSSYSKPLEGPPSMRHVGVAQPCPRAAPILEGRSCNKRTTRNTASHEWSQSLEDTARAGVSYPSHVWQDCPHPSEAMRESSGYQTSWQNSACRPAFFQGAISDRMPSRDFFLQGVHAQSTSFGDAMTKKRRLTFEKVPGAKDGQTRLTFH